MFGHPIHNCCLCLFFLEMYCVYLDAERLDDHIKWEMFQMRTPGASQTSAEKRQCS